MTILCYVDWMGWIFDNHVLRRLDGMDLLTIMYYVDRREGFVDNIVLSRREGRIC